MSDTKFTTTGSRLKMIMNERNLKQVDILRLTEPFQKKYNVKIAKNDLSQYVNDKTEPRQDKLFVLALALEVSEPWLMGYDVSRNRDVNIPDYLQMEAVYDQLQPDRKQKVFQFAKSELNKQKGNVVKLPETLAAHADDIDHEYKDNEIMHNHGFLQDAIKKYRGKNKK